VGDPSPGPGEAGAWLGGRVSLARGEGRGVPMSLVGDHGHFPELVEMSPAWRAGGKKVGKGGNRAEDRGRKRKETRPGFLSFFVKGNLMFGQARNEPVEREAPKGAWQTASR